MKKRIRNKIEKKKARALERRKRCVSWDAHLQERLKDPEFKEAYEKESAKLRKELEDLKE